jgi:hypothetical protein
VTDQLEDLFAELRTDTLTEVRPPGIEAARRTVHRRRTTKAVGGAAFVAVIAAGGIGSHLLGPLPFGPGSDRDPAALAKRQGRAATEVGLGAGDSRQTLRSMQGIAAAGVIATGLLVAGTYTLRLACAGPGRLTALFRVKDASGGTAQLVNSSTQDCAASKPAVRTFTLAESAAIEAELRPDGDATDQAGYAFTLTLHDADLQRLSDDVSRRLRPDPRKGLFEIGGPTHKVETGDGRGIATLSAGSYRLRYVCSGVGRVRVTVGVRGADRVTTPSRTSSRTVTCGSSEPVTTFPFEIRPGDALTTAIEPDDDAVGQSAYAELVEVR